MTGTNNSDEMHDTLKQKYYPKYKLEIDENLPVYPVEE